MSYSERERIFAEHREILDFLELRADHAVQGEQAALSKLSDAEHHARLLFEEQKNHVLSEARCQMNMQELRVESAHRALREQSLQIHSLRMEFYQASQSYDESQSLVNQRTVQTQDLQDKVNSLNDSKEFHDPDTAGSSGLSHVPSELMSIPSPREMVSRDSCLQSDTPNFYGTSENVL